MNSPGWPQDSKKPRKCCSWAGQRSSSSLWQQHLPLQNSVTFCSFGCREGKDLVPPPLHREPRALNPSLPALQRTCSKMKWQESSVTQQPLPWHWGSGSTARVSVLGRVGQLSWAETRLGFVSFVDKMQIKTSTSVQSHSLHCRGPAVMLYLSACCKHLKVLDRNNNSSKGFLALLRARFHLGFFPLSPSLQLILVAMGCHEDLGTPGYHEDLGFVLCSLRKPCPKSFLGPSSLKPLCKS